MALATIEDLFKECGLEVFVEKFKDVSGATELADLLESTNEVRLFAVRFLLRLLLLRYLLKPELLEPEGRLGCRFCERSENQPSRSFFNCLGKELDEALGDLGLKAMQRKR